jgi:hypothetical protein
MAFLHAAPGTENRERVDAIGAHDIAQNLTECGPNLCNDTICHSGFHTLCIGLSLQFERPQAVSSSPLFPRRRQL